MPEKKKAHLVFVKKGQRCGKGWTLIERKVGKKILWRACVRGKAVRAVDMPELLSRYEREGRAPKA